MTAGFSTSPLLSRTYGYHRGFHHFADLIPNESDSLLRRLKGGQRLLRYPLTHHISALARILTRPARSYVSGAELTDHACRWLDQTTTPFFCWMHYMDIHWPYHLEETLNRPKEIAQAWRDLGHMNRLNRKGEPTTPVQHNHYRRLYEEAVRYTDAQLGRLLDYLERSGRLNDTIIILVSDHGEEFLERRHWGHFETNLYDEILRVPLIIYLPDLPAGQVVQRQVRTLDIMPTLLDLCACSPPAGLEGTTLRPLWEAGNGTYDPELSISEMWRDNQHIVAIRTETFKYIWYSRQPEKPELYDLSADPGEQDNALARYPEQARQFQGQVDAHLSRVTQSRRPTHMPPELDEQLIRRLRDLGYVA
jgi:arylsulfatase A-like enzyme